MDAWTRESSRPTAIPRRGLISAKAEDTSRLRSFSGTHRRRRFGRYETLFRIAGGGMAEVYAARIIGEGGFEKVVALKRMLPTLAEDDRFVTMFLDEGRVAANISSPHVVQTMDLGRAEDDSLFLVMELVVGVPLSRLVRNVLKTGKHLEIPVVIEILAQAAMGLHDAHVATTPMGDPLQIVHRDISPQNILVDRAGRTRITDFGVARALQRSTHTQTGEVKGKMAYFAPEQAVGGKIDHRVDVFALGVVAWESFAGRRLFKSENPLQTLQKITIDPIPSLKDVRPAIPQEVNDCVMKALTRDVESRYPTARDFATALRASIDRPASTSEVGAYIRAHGGEALAKLENGMQTALSSTEAPVVPAPGPGEELEGVTTVGSTSQIVRSDSMQLPAGVARSAMPAFILPLLGGLVATVLILGGYLIFRPERSIAPTQVGTAPPSEMPTSGMSAPMVAAPPSMETESVMAEVPSGDAEPGEREPEEREPEEREPVAMVATMRRGRGMRGSARMSESAMTTSSTMTEAMQATPMDTAMAPAMTEPAMTTETMSATTPMETSSSMMGILAGWDD